MADKYIDKIKYSDTYFLQDSGATHDNSHNLSGTAGNFKSNGTIVAEQGIFNKLIATSAAISTLDVSNLTAQNATVVGLLDVQGQLKTNTWTNSNIATIEGNFFIAPTISSSPSTLTITNESSTNSSISSITGMTKKGWTITIAGSFIVNQVGADPVSGENSTVQWAAGSKVLITGDIEKSDGVYPLGTLKGYIETTPTMNSSGITTSIKVQNLTDNLGSSDIFSILSAGTYSYRNIKISLTQRYYSGFRPIGISMSAQGRSSKSFIDIYGGANLLQEGNLDPSASTHNTTDYGGFAIPNVRIGNLYGLPNIRTGDFTDNAFLPKGWGIYTTNGYFQGTIAADNGYLASGVTVGDDSEAVELGDLGTKNEIMALDEELSNQINNKSSIWYGVGEPTITNYPYTNWNTESLPLHLNDIYYDINTGYSYKLISITNGQNITYEWSLIENYDVQQLKSHVQITDNAITITKGNEQGSVSVNITGDKISFCYGNDEVAYISGEKLYINQSVVLQQMDVGRNANDNNGLGQWSWKVHENNNGQNNLYLKWLG